MGNQYKISKRLRDYDSEDRRQRRLGMAQAGALGAGGVLAFRGGRGILRSTKNLRKITGMSGIDSDAMDAVRAMRKTGVLASRGDLGYLGGGLAGIGGAGVIRQHAENPNNRRYL